MDGVHYVLFFFAFLSVVRTRELLGCPGAVFALGFSSSECDLIGDKG